MMLGSIIGMVLVLLACATHISAFSAEFNAIRSLDVISAVDSKPKEVGKMILQSHPSDSVLICFRSFG